MDDLKTLRELVAAGEELDAERSTGISGEEALRAHLSAGLQWRDQAANARPALARLLAKHEKLVAVAEAAGTLIATIDGGHSDDAAYNDGVGDADERLRAALAALDDGEDA